VRTLISSFSAVQEHRDISNGTLKISDIRLVYIGRLEGNICAWFPIWEEFESVNDLPSILSEKDSIHLCVPVEREQYETAPLDLKPKLSNRRSRAYSATDIKESKRPRSNTRSIKKESIKKESMKTESIKTDLIKTEDSEECELEFDDNKLFDIKEEVIKKEAEVKVEGGGSKRRIKKPARFAD
jgi:hypothetical protein